MIWIETIVNGVLYGGLYGLLGVGLALIVGVMRVVNLSHGEFIVLSAFVGVSLAHIVPGVHPLVLLRPSPSSPSGWASACRPSSSIVS